MQALWKCPRCRRVFRQVNQRHACGVGSRAQLLKGKPPALVKLYRALEKTVKAYPGVEIVAHGRYALFRATRVFADLVFMSDALRLAIVLDRQVNDRMFFKVQRMSAHRIGHVAKLRSLADWRAVRPYLQQAHRLAQRERQAATKPV